MRRDENDRDVTLAHRQVTLELEPAHPRHPDIEYEAIGALQVLRTREVVGGRECLHTQPDRADQTAQRFADRLIVIHNRNQRDWGHGRKVGGFSPLIYYIFV